MKYNSYRNTMLLALFAALPFLAQALDAGVSYAVFSTPDGNAYLEVNLEVAAPSVMYRHVDSLNMQASVEVLILVKNGDNIVNYEKYTLKSPIVGQPENLLDVKRLSLPQGKYTLEVSVVDSNDATNSDAYTTPLTVAFDGKIALSEVQLLRSFHADNSDNPFAKNGYYLEPLPFNYYDRSATLLAFYAEIYHSDQSVTDGKYHVRYVIEKDAGSGHRTLISAGSQDKTAGPIDALLVRMDIAQLESGNYDLIVELRSSGNDLLASRTLSFQRSNPFLTFKDNEMTDEMLSQQFVQNLDKDALVYALRSISPLMAGDQSATLINILKEEDLKQMRYFLFHYFAEQDANNPEQAFRDYMALANAANKKFKSGFRYGFETDRGRTFLRFGQADDVVHVEDEPGAPPYEIWIYYKFPKTGQSNVKFLFYNPSLAGDDYILLHSNARGEIKNPKWERELYKKNPTEYTDGNYNDATGVQRNIGRNAKAYFDDF